MAGKTGKAPTQPPGEALEHNRIAAPGRPALDVGQPDALERIGEAAARERRVAQSFATSTRACVEEALGRDRNAFHRRRCASAITRVLPIARPWPFLPPGFPALRSQMSPLITPPSQAFS
jgi:hypothetical protein